MQLRQKTELRKLLAPQLNQSLKVLCMSLPEIKQLVQEELVNNPFLEEAPPEDIKANLDAPLYSYQDRIIGPDLSFRLDMLTEKTSLQDVLNRQLCMFSSNEEDLKIGQEIIGNIDENGYLKATLEQIADATKTLPEKVENVLKIIQQFEPSGVGARNIAECLTVQLKMAGEGPLLLKIVESYLKDVAKKNYGLIAKALGEPEEKIRLLVKKITKLNPKPGRNYSESQVQRISPDIMINDRGEDLQVTISNEDIPALSINDEYRQMLKKKGLDPQAKELLKNKLRNALELLRSVSKRKSTLIKIMQIVLEIQQEAIKEDISCLKPLTFKDVAEKIGMHETTVCRAIMHKYVQLPDGTTIALKEFFPSHIHDKNGQSLSSTRAKELIRELIEQEDKNSPLSDREITDTLLQKQGLNISRRTVAKYREELKILSTAFRKEK